MFQRFKKMSIVEVVWWVNWLTRESKEIVYWLNIDWSRRTKRSNIDWISTDLDKQKDRLLTVFIADSLIDWLSKQKDQQLIVIFANSRSFSLTHDASSESRMQSSFSKRKFSFRWSENALCKLHSIHEDSFCCFVISLERIFVSLIWKCSM